MHHSWLSTRHNRGHHSLLSRGHHSCLKRGHNRRHISSSAGCLNVLGSSGLCHNCCRLNNNNRVCHIDNRRHRRASSTSPSLPSRPAGDCVGSVISTSVISTIELWVQTCCPGCPTCVGREQPLAAGTAVSICDATPARRAAALSTGTARALCCCSTLGSRGSDPCAGWGGRGGGRRTRVRGRRWGRGRRRGAGGGAHTELGQAARPTVVACDATRSPLAAALSIGAARALCCCTTLAARCSKQCTVGGGTWRLWWLWWGRGRGRGRRRGRRRGTRGARDNDVCRRAAGSKPTHTHTKTCISHTATF